MSASTDYRKCLGNAIRERRVRRGLTQESLAESADLHHNFVGRVERGEEFISLQALLRIFQAMKVSIIELVKDLR